MPTMLTRTLIDEMINRIIIVIFYWKKNVGSLEFKVGRPAIPIVR